MCSIDDVERCTVLSDQIRKARKAHKCYECGREILAKESYRYETTIMDGYPPEAHKTCMHCNEGPRKLLYEKCHGFVYGQILEDIEDHFSVKEWGYKAARFAVGIRRKWKSFKQDGLLPVPN